MTARRVALPNLALGEHGLSRAAAEGTGGPLPARRRGALPPPPAAEATKAEFHLLSPAFHLDPKEPFCQESCAAQLGTDPAHVSFYVLAEVASASDLPPGCRDVAVAVKGSSERGSGRTCTSSIMVCCALIFSMPPIS